MNRLGKKAPNMRDWTSTLPSRLGNQPRRIACIVVLGTVLCGGCSGDPSPSAKPPTVTATATETVTETVTAPPTAAPNATPTATGFPETQTHVLRGTLQLSVNRNPRFPENCTGFDEEGYGDIHVGQQVVVSGPNGETIAVGSLESCRFWPLESPEQARGIEFIFEVNDVPEVPFLTVAVGSGNRGEVTKSLDDLRKSEWEISLSL